MAVIVGYSMRLFNINCLRGAGSYPPIGLSN